MNAAIPQRPYPWQQQHWSTLMTRHGAGRMPHALLFSGQRGMGKEDLALCLAQAVLCSAPDTEGVACGQCRSCLLFQAGNHPDFTRLSPEEAGKNITINRVRSLGQWLTTTSQYEGFKVAIITPAEAMNTAAANSLLKTLEEPPSHTLLILVSSQASRLLPTVRSRCQQITFSPPPRAQTQAWLSQLITNEQERELLLSLAQQAPLRAVELAQAGAIAERHELFAELEKMQKGQLHPADIAEACLARGVRPVIDCLSSWLADLIRLHFSAATPPINVDFTQQLQRLAEKIDIKPAYRYLDKLQEARRLADTQANEQMLLEDLLISWSALTR